MAIDRFLYREVRLLDERRFEEWAELFSEDGLYWVPARPEQTDPDHEVSLFRDDRAMMAARIRRLRHPRVHAETPPTRTVRALSNLEIGEPAGDGSVEAHAVLTMAELRSGEQIMWSGRCTWTLVPGGDGWRIRRKRVDLVNADAMHRLMTVPF